MQSIQHPLPYRTNNPAMYFTSPRFLSCWEDFVSDNHLHFAYDDCAMINDVVAEHSPLSVRRRR